MQGQPNSRHFCLVVITFSVTLIVMSGCSTKPADKVCIKGSCFDVEIAEMAIERQQGLMYRESLAQEKGMLFIFENEGFYPFWMKNTLIPLDMVWIGADYKIVDIQHNALPCKQDPCPSYSPSGNALYVLEVNAGTAEKLGWQPRDSVEISLSTQ